MTFSAFVEGPLVWIAFLIFFIGSAFRLLFFFTLSTKKDKPVYHYYKSKWMFLSILRWLFPVNPDLKKNPVFSTLGYIFHICLLGVPIFYGAHIYEWEQSRFNWKWWTMPDKWADWMSLILLAIAIFFIIRRLVLAEVRIITTVSDYTLIIICALPFLSGYANAHPDGTIYKWVTTLIPIYSTYPRELHILTGALMMIVVPFSKLSHWVLFFTSRMVTGVEFGRRNYTV